MSHLKITHKRNLSLQKTPYFIEQIYGRNSKRQFRKLLVNRVNKKQKDYNTVNTRLVSMNSSLRSQELTQQDPQKYDNKKIKEFVRDAFHKRHKTSLLQQNADFITQERPLNPREQRISKSSIEKQSLERSTNNQNEDSIININNQVQQIIKNKISRFTQNNKKLVKLPRHKTQQGQAHKDSHLFNELFKKKSKLKKLPEPDIKNENKLDELVKRIRLIKQQPDNDLNLELNNKKIEIIQKIIAQKSAQSQVAKKYYFQYLTDKKDILKKPQHKNYKLSIPIVKRSQRSIFTQSINNASYKRPKMSDYNIYRYRQKPFERNNQPVPKSTYHQQYIQYLNLPSTNFSCRRLDYSLSELNDYRQKKSTYSQDFHEMHANRINYKELDSYKDKFKDIDVSYITKKDKRINTELLRQLKVDEQIKINNKKEFIPQLKQQLISQKQRQFKGNLSQNSVIKHKQLSKLKYSYKQLIQS